MRARQDEMDLEGKPKPWYYAHLDVSAVSIRNPVI